MASENAVPTNEERNYLSPKEFAQLTGFSLVTVRRYLSSGRLPKYQPGGKNCRVGIPLAVLELFLDSTAPKTADESPAGSEPEPSQQSSPRTHQGPPPRWMERR